MDQHFPGSPATPPPLLAAALAVDEQLKQVAGNDPTFLSTSEKESFMLTLVHVRDQIDGLLVETLAVSGDVADQHAARTAGSWLATVTNADPRVMGRLQRLAEETKRWPRLGAALRDGSVSLRHGEVIAASLAALGAEVSAEVEAQALEYLIASAAEFDPGRLRRLGDGVLHFVDPEAFDDAERKKLEAELAKAKAATRLFLKPQGDGTTRLSGVVSDAVAARFKTYLSAFSSPRHDAATGGTVEDSRYLDPVTGKRLSQDRVLGEALCAFLEAADPERMPSQGGAATSVIVTIDLQDLLNDTGIGVAAGEAVPVGEVRRLACQAGIIPAVLGGKSEVLDLGRSRRFFSAAQRKALTLKFPTCAVDGCQVRAEQCEAHHDKPWSHGGPTDLADGIMLCPRHHHCVHEDRYQVRRLPGGGLNIQLRR